MIWGSVTDTSNTDGAASSGAPPAIDEVTHDAKAMDSANQNSQQYDKNNYILIIILVYLYLQIFQNNFL